MELAGAPNWWRFGTATTEESARRLSPDNRWQQPAVRTVSLRHGGSGEGTDPMGASPVPALTVCLSVHDCTGDDASPAYATSLSTPDTLRCDLAKGALAAHVEQRCHVQTSD